MGLLKPTFGSALLTQTAPAPQTNIAGLTFTWTQGLILKRTTITGKDLINKYQLSYGEGYVLGDGVNEGLTSQSLNYNMWVKTVSLGNYLTKSDGSALFGGSYVLSNVLLLGDGFVLGDGDVLGDGYVLGDGFVLGDGYVLGDGFVLGDCSLGDSGAGMK